MSCSSCQYFVSQDRTCSRLGRPVARCAGGCTFNRKPKEGQPEAVSDRAASAAAPPEPTDDSTIYDVLVGYEDTHKVASKSLNSAIKYYGGKSYQTEQILANFPKRYHVYVEGFGGGASILLKKNPTPLEVYNDLGQNVYSLFRVLSDREKFWRLKERMDVTYFSYQIWDEARKSLEDPGLSVDDRAYAFLVTNRQGYNGIGGWSVAMQVRRNMSKSVSDYLSMIDRLPELHDRLSSVIVENHDIFYVIDRYDAEDTFFYLDPPYVRSTRKTSSATYECEMTDDDHRKFVERMLTVKGKLLISGYDHSIYAPLTESGKFVKVCYNSPNSNRDCVECLWRNYEVDLEEGSGVRVWTAGADGQEPAQGEAEDEDVHDAAAAEDVHDVVGDDAPCSAETAGTAVGAEAVDDEAECQAVGDGEDDVAEDDVQPCSLSDHVDDVDDDVTDISSPLAGEAEVPAEDVVEDAPKSEDAATEGEAPRNEDAVPVPEGKAPKSEDVVLDADAGLRSEQLMIDEILESLR